MAIFRALLTARLEKSDFITSLNFKEQKDMIKMCLRLNNDDTVRSAELEMYNEVLSISRRDIEQLQLAKRIDQTSYTDNYIGERENSQRWELSLYEYLENKGITFIKEESLQQEKVQATPDALFEANSLRINNCPVR